MLSPNTILQNRYRVIRELGHGGMGTVYEALDQRVNCIVALKETMAGNDEEGRRAFEREASLLGNLRHSALPKVMDYFTEGGGDFLVMEFIPGYDLAELLESRESPFSQSQVLRWADELLRVLEYLHKQDPPILHRDIKPSNLKLTKQGEIFLLDFGLAKGSLGQMATLATSRSVRGYTPVYAALEQIHGHGTDARSDIYSLGATLYHLLTGIAPTDAPTRFHAVEDERPDPLPSIETVNPQASSNVAAVLRQAMTISRKQRLVSASEMRKALRNAAEEDERHSAEEEYARAESRRRLRDEEKRAAEAALTRADEQERELREAETRKKQEDARRREIRKQQEEERQAQADRRRREEEERSRIEADQRIAAKEAEQRRRGQILETTPAPTVQAPEPSSGREPSLPAMKTIAAPPPERVPSIPSSKTNRSFESFHAPAAKKNYTLTIVAGVVVLSVVAGLIVWTMSGGSGQETTSNSDPSQTTSPSQTASSNKKPPAPAQMVYVSGGTFMMGRDNGVDVAERPAHQVTVSPFFIDFHEVTNEDYLKFVRATGHRPPMTWRNGVYGRDRDRYPVTGVSWDDAAAYATWAGKRLPSEEEWEFAARGTDGRLYPWGNNWQSGLANAEPREWHWAGNVPDLQQAGRSAGPDSNSPFGAADMVGNAWEWTSSDFRAYPRGTLPPNQPSGDLKVIRGGSYESTKEYATTTYRTGWPARGAKTYDQTGFRCVKNTGQ